MPPFFMQNCDIIEKGGKLMKLRYEESIDLKNSNRSISKLSNRYHISSQTARKVRNSSIGYIVRSYADGDNPFYRKIRNIYRYKSDFRVVFSDKTGLFSRLCMNASREYILNSLVFMPTFSLLTVESKVEYIRRLLHFMGYDRVTVVPQRGVNELDRPFMAVADGSRIYWNDLLTLITKIKGDKIGKNV